MGRIEWYVAPNSRDELVMTISRRGLSFNKAFATLVGEERRLAFGIDKEDNNAFIVMIPSKEETMEARRLGTSNNISFASTSKDFKRWIFETVKLEEYSKYKLVKYSEDEPNVYRAEKIGD